MQDVTWPGTLWEFPVCLVRGPCMLSSEVLVNAS